MKRRRGIVIAVGMLVILSLTAVVWAQVSTNFDLSWYILADGGGERQSANYLVQDTLGEWVGDTSSCGWHKVQTGFWYGVVPAPPIQCKVYLPLTLKNHWPGPWEDEPNNDYSQANGPLRSGEDYFGFPNDTNDYFSIYLQAAGSINITLTNQTGAGVELLLYYQTPFASCPNSQVPQDSRVCARDFGAKTNFAVAYNATNGGWYYIRIFTGSNYNNTKYTLRTTYP
jgi:hypothetical protein